MTLVVRAMCAQDIADSYAMTQQLSWPHRYADVQQALELGEGVVADYQGKVVGTALLWRWGEESATIGLVMVDPLLRGRGVGRQLMQSLLARVPGYRVRLHATTMGRALYEKLGFVAQGEILQYQTAELTQIPHIPLPRGVTLRPAQRQDAAALTTLDYQANGFLRSRLINHLIVQHQTLLLEDARGAIQGFASLRRFGHGWVIGPIIAAELSAARQLIAALMQTLRGEFLRIDTDAALPLGNWLATLDLTLVDNPVMMVRGEPWQSADMCAFGLMTQAMG